MTRVHLSRDREQTQRMHQRAMHQINQVLDLCLNSTRTKQDWACLRRENHLELYAKRTATAMSASYFLGVNEASSGFDEVLELLQYDSTKQFRLMMKLVHGRDFKDGALISMRTRKHSLSDWTYDTQHAAIWFTFQDRSRSMLLRDKSFTLFQTLKVFAPDGHIIPSGALVGRPSDSVHKRTVALSWLPFPETDEELLWNGAELDEGNSQLNLQYTLIIEELDRDRLRISCVTSVYHDGDEARNGSRWSARAIARRLAFRSVARLDAAVAAARISAHALVAPHQWIKNEERLACVICWKLFNPFYRRRHHCRLCGEVICGSCSSMRKTKVMKASELQKVRICHLCSNKARVKGDSFASTVDTAPTMLRIGDEPLPTARLLPGAPTTMNDFYQRKESNQATHDNAQNDDDEYITEDDNYDGYIGAGPESLIVYTSRKLISIKSLTASEEYKVFRSMTNLIPPTSNQRKIPLQPQSKSNDELLRQGQRESISFLHPAALQTNQQQHPSQPIVAESSTYTDYGLSPPVSDEDFDDSRETSLISSNAGLLDRYFMDEGYFLPKLDPAQEAQRLRLLQLVASPACTFVDRTVMQRSCEIATSAFGVQSAFIARVEENHVLIDYALGIAHLSANDEFFRHHTLCDFVLVQQAMNPLVILDCLTDPRTRDIPMVQQLCIRFFVGVCICVRGLPLACLCAFGQDDGEEQLATSRYDLNILENAAHSIEVELENLVCDLNI